MNLLSLDAIDLAAENAALRVQVSHLENALNRSSDQWATTRTVLLACIDTLNAEARGLYAENDRLRAQCTGLAEAAMSYSRALLELRSRNLLIHRKSV